MSIKVEKGNASWTRISRLIDKDIVFEATKTKH